MTCSTDCKLNGLHYIFHQEATGVTYAAAFNNCGQQTGGGIAFANTQAIRTHLFECCRNDQEFWVAFTNSDLVAKTDGDCPLFKARADSQTISTCNSLRNYICQVPVGTTGNVATINPSTTPLGTRNNTALLTPASAGALAQTNVGLIIGIVFAVVLLLLMLVALYHFRLRHLNTKKFSKAGFKKCALGCVGTQKESSTSTAPRAATQEDHGYYSIRVHEDRSGSNSVYSYITDPANTRSGAATPDLRAQQNISKAPPLSAPTIGDISTHYETIDNTPQQQAKATRVIPPPPTVDPPPIPGNEEGIAGTGGVTYTTLLVPEEEQGVSYTTITRVLGEPPSDPYAVVHKNSVGSRK